MQTNESRTKPQHLQQPITRSLTRSDALFVNRLLKNKTLHLTIDPDSISHKWQGDRFLSYGLRSAEVHIMRATTLREVNAMQALSIANNQEFDFREHYQAIQEGEHFIPDEDLSVRLLQLLCSKGLAHWDSRSFYYLFSAAPTQTHIRAVMQALVLESRLMAQLQERDETSKLVKI